MRSWVVVVVAVVVGSCSEREPALAVATAPTVSSDPVAAGPAAVPAASEGSALGWLDLGHVESDGYGPRRVRLWLPSAEGGPWPVLVVLDGQGAEDWFELPRTVEELAREGRIPPHAVVAVDSTSARDTELAATDGRFVSFLADVVLPQVREAASISVRPEDVAIVGFSYGGLQAVVAVTRRRDTFGRAVAMSPSLWVHDGAALRAFVASDAPLPVRLWVDAGTEEAGERMLVRPMLADARALRDAAMARGMVYGRDVAELEALGESHDMAAAGRRMRAALGFALGSVDLSTTAPRSLSIARLPAVGRRSAFTIVVEHEGGLRLSWPRSLAELWAGETDLRRDVAAVDRPLRVRALGLEATCD